ncbi:MAG: SH3 domain-containing protein [Planctomycetes bacterium]|nr:SH3 domain-containing protein [Planctomycetota bacterium]
MRPTTTPLALLALLCLTSPALADPPFRGPEVHRGAWPVTRAWSDPAAGPGDRSQGSLAYAFRAFALERAREHEAARTRLDCADLAIDLVIEYAARHGLPVEWRVWYPPERRFVTVKSSDRQFGSPEAFSDWSKYYLGALNLADNTVAISYDDWAGGDVVLMNWNQTDVEPNFPGRVVWHTYLIGVPDELIFYGNMNDGAPLPVVSTGDAHTLERVRSHPDRHGLSPRRFAFMARAVRGPEVGVEEVVVQASLLNLREAPSTSAPIITRARSGERLEVVLRQGLWVQLRLADGALVWGHSAYLRPETRWQPAPPSLTGPAPTPAPTPGLVSALPGS